MKRDNPKKILIIRNDHIGDMVLSTHIFREIKKSFPKSRITVLASKINAPIIIKNKNVDEILVGNCAKYNLKSIKEYFIMFKRIKNMKFDAGIDLRGSVMNSFFLLWLPKIGKRISRIDMHPRIRFFLTHPIKIEKNSHITKDNLQILEGLQIKSRNDKLEVVLDKQDKKEVEKFILANKLKKFVCFCPIAGLEKKQWPIEKWKQLINKFRGDFQILLLGVKREENILREISRENSSCKIVLDFDIRKLSLLFKKSKFVLAQDGGPMHIAWSSRANLIALENLFLSHMNKFIPLGNVKIIRSRTKNMDSISFKEVKKEVENILNNG